MRWMWRRRNHREQVSDAVIGLWSNFGGRCGAYSADYVDRVRPQAGEGQRDRGQRRRLGS